MPESSHRLYERYQQALKAVPNGPDRFHALQQVSDLEQLFIPQALAEKHPIYEPIARKMIAEDVRRYELFQKWENSPVADEIAAELDELYGDDGPADDDGTGTM